MSGAGGPPPAGAGPRAWIRALKLTDGSLRARATSGAALLLFREGYTSALRLAANLVMTRLLFPEAFGLMLIVNLVMMALEMLSDVGIRGAMIARQEKLDESYIDTAWTMLVVRGVILALFGVAIAQPVAAYYQQPELAGLIAFSSLAALISGFSSPWEIIRAKQIRLARVVFWRAGVQTIALLLTIAWLLIHPSIWALAATRVIAAVLTAVSSHRVLGERLPRLRWSGEHAGEIFNFGKWVFISTALTFLARQGDALLVSKWVGPAELGLFSIASALALLVQNVVGALNSNLLLPMYSELRAGGAARVSAGQRRIGIGVMALSLPFVLLFALLGRDLIALLYDPRYLGAGWILEILSIGALFFAVSASASSIMLAFGDSFRHMLLQFFRFAALLLAMSIGGWLAGFEGLIWGASAAQAVYYPLVVLAARKYCSVDPRPELLFVFVTLAVIGSVWTYRGWPGAH